MIDTEVNMTGSEIAVIGIAGRFPGAKNIAEFWQNLKNGVESLAFVSDEELTTLDIPEGWLQNPNYVRVKGGKLEGKEFFDASFFGYTQREAEIMDPQMRIFHECAWSALEDAGYDMEKYHGAIGLYTGAGSSSYWEFLASISGKCDELGVYASGLLYDAAHLSTKIAYNFNLKGPCFSVQTACSTSLVTVHLACQGILNGECDMALAGGVNIVPHKTFGYIFQEGMIYSADGHCRPFDAKARGTVFGEGCGVVLLKPLADAVSDGDHIYAIIKGTAINNDGLRKIGYTAPSIEGQAEVITMAQRMAEVEPESITYAEAHGTGTELGDPIEIEALKVAFNTDKKNFCGVGSVKSNIGHLDSAAGAAGLIKVILALKYRLIPPSLHFVSPNPRIDFENSPFYVVNRLKEWEPVNGYPLRACVSSFGIGGTNAHAILEEWPPVQDQPLDTETAQIAQTGDRQYWLIPLSGKTPTALDRLTENLCHFFKNEKNISLANAAYTLSVGRRDLEYRRMFVCKDMDQAIRALSNPAAVEVHNGQEESPVIFMFPGLGGQYENMAKELYRDEPIFRDELNRCFDILNPLVDYHIKEILYPGEEGAVSQGKGLLDFEVARLAVFVIEYALARLLIKWGIRPDAMIGYGFGEYAAACVRGAVSLEDSFKAILAIGKSGEKHLTAAHFADEIKDAIKKENAVFIEVGPGRDLSLLVESFAGSPNRRLLDLLRPVDREVSDTYYLLNKIGQLWLYGQRLDWEQFYPRQTGLRVSRISLPTYPFEGEYYWFDEKLLKENYGRKDEPGPKKQVAVVLKPRPQLMNPYTAAGSEVEEKIAHEWQRLFGYDRIGMNDNFYDLGGDSLMAVNLAALMNKAGFNIVLADILSNPTIKQLAPIISERKASQELEEDIYERRLLSQLECIEKLNKGHHEKNIFIIHPLHGMVNPYKDMAVLLEHKFNVYGVQARGIKPGSSMAEDPVRMVDDYIEQILEVQKNGSYIIGGYCNGVDIAYEIVRKLENLNHPVESLILADPHVLFPYQFVKRLRILGKLPDFFRNRLAPYYNKKYRQRLLLLESREKEAEPGEETGAGNFSKKKFESRIELLSRHIIPTNIINAPIFAVIAEASLLPSTLTEGPRATKEELGYMTKGNVTLVQIPGDHNSIWERPFVEKFAEVVLNNI
jgi:acyl transferase domain-containing protein/thioesterase domain-containing protein